MQISVRIKSTFPKTALIKTMHTTGTILRIPINKIQTRRNNHTTLKIFDTTMVKTRTTIMKITLSRK